MTIYLKLPSSRVPLYYYYQEKTTAEKWKPKQYIDGWRDLLVKDKCVYHTALFLDRVIDETSTAEEVAQTKYVGDLYLDWDCEEIEGAIKSVKEFAEKMLDKGVALNQLRWFASGKKGFHCEVPATLFIAGNPYAPRLHLPLIYKHMAEQLATAYQDLRIYTAKRGRMWRTVNVQRTDNNMYKVPLTPKEVMQMTPELYEELIQKPRVFATMDGVVEGTVLPPDPVTELNPSLQSLFQRCTDKVESKAKTKNRRKKVNALQVWEGQVPPTIEQMCNGVGFKPEAGFQSIATQLALIAHELKWSQDEFVDKCLGLCLHHQSDSSRYNSEEKRRKELGRMWEYMEGDFTYEFAKAPIAALLNHPARDLDGIANETVAEQARSEIAKAQAGEQVRTGRNVTDYLVWTDKGLIALRDDAEDLITNVVLTEPQRITDLATGEDIGIRCSASTAMDGMQGESRTILLKNTAFTDRKGLQLQMGGLNSFWTGSDKDMQMLRVKLAEEATKGGRQNYIVNREGLDFIQVPHSQSPVLKAGFPAWVDVNSVKTTQEVLDQGATFEYSNGNDPNGFYGTDLMSAPKWAENNTETCLAVVKAWLTSNKSETLAPMIGWFCAAHFRMFFAQRPESNFPLLHIAGMAGSAKTASTSLNLRLHYYQVDHRMYSPASTQFAVTVASTKSASIPLVMDEYKPSRMNPQKLEDLRSLFRSAYNAATRQTGGGNTHSADARAIQKDRMTAPVVFIAEQIEQETALVERSVLVSMSRAPLAKREEYRKKYRLVADTSWVLSAIGRRIVERAISDGYEAFIDRFRQIEDQSQQRFFEYMNKLTIPVDASDRVPFSHAVTVFGLSVLKDVLDENFAEDAELQSIFADLDEASVSWFKHIVTTVQAEIEKWLTDVALMSQRAGSPISAGKAYAFVYPKKSDGLEDMTTAPVSLEMDAYICLEEYLAYCRITGKERLYDKLPALIHSLTAHQAFQVSGGQKLAGKNVVTLSLGELAKVGIPMFKGGS